MPARTRLGRIYDVQMGLRYSPFIILALSMFPLGSVAGIGQEAVDRRTELLIGLRGKTSATGVPWASVMRCRGLHPPLPQRV
jgi:hypothetical protein